jgi:hypothetical protein
MEKYLYISKLSFGVKIKLFYWYLLSVINQFFEPTHTILFLQWREQISTSKNKYWKPVLKKKVLQWFVMKGWKNQIALKCRNFGKIWRLRIFLKCHVQYIVQKASTVVNINEIYFYNLWGFLYNVLYNNRLNWIIFYQNKE